MPDFNDQLFITNIYNYTLFQCILRDDGLGAFHKWRPPVTTSSLWVT